MTRRLKSKQVDFRENQITDDVLKMIKNYLEIVEDRLVWKAAPALRVKPGDDAGYWVGDFVKVTLDGKRYHATNIAWYLHYGDYPQTIVRFIDDSSVSFRADNLTIVKALSKQMKAFWFDRDLYLTPHGWYARVTNGDDIGPENEPHQAHNKRAIYYGKNRNGS